MKNYEDYKMTPRQEKFVKLANDNGFVTKISRKDIVILQAKYGIKWPAWLINHLVKEKMKIIKLNSIQPKVNLFLPNKSINA